MAKELPYFKFEPNQWENGNIQMLSRDKKGLFIDLCSVYWSRLGDVPVKLAVQKLCGGNASALDSLCDEKIISIVDGQICIDFLNEQLQEFDEISKQNSKNAKEGWLKRRNKAKESERNASESNPQSKNDAIREDKRKEDKSKDDKPPEKPKKKITPPTEQEFLDYCKTIKEFKYQDYEYSLKSKYQTWLQDGWKDGYGKPIKNWKTKIMNAYPHLSPIKNSNNQGPTGLQFVA